MNSYKFLLRRSFGRWQHWVIPLLITAAALVTTIIWNEPLGAESGDYMICKGIGALAGPALFGSFMGIFLCADLTGNRAMRSSAIAKHLYTTALPTFILGLMLAVAAVQIAVYSVACALGAIPQQELSDYIILCGAAVFYMTIAVTIADNIRYGMILLIYSFMLIFLTYIPGRISESGFGLPIGTAAVIFAGMAALGYIISKIIAHAFFRKADFKAYAPYAAEMLQR